jgi:peptidoglycan-associated lipoprotein
MKKLFLSFVMLGVLAGCTTEPTKPADVTTGTPSQPPVVETKKPETGPTTTVPDKPRVVTGDPLDPLNPQSSLYKQRSVFFDYDSFVVKDEYKPLVTSHSRYLSTNRNQKITIEGNTDERGSREYNIALGQKRADSVKQMMILLGVRDDQIESVSFGEEKPRNPGHDEAAFSQNRRADIRYSGDK